MIKGGCQSGSKVVSCDSKSDLLLQGVPVQKVMFQLALTERNIQFQVNLMSFSWS